MNKNKLFLKVPINNYRTDSVPDKLPKGNLTASIGFTGGSIALTKGSLCNF